MAVFAAPWHRRSVDVIPGWGRKLSVALALGLMAFALHRYIAGLERHVEVVSYIAHDFAREQLANVAASPISEYLHRLGGAALVLAGLLQFSDGLRRRAPRVHRAIGWVYVALALVSAVSGIWMVLHSNFGGALEVVPILVFGPALIVTTLVALTLALRREFVRHRVWMIRSYALVLGPMTVRIVYVPLWTLLGLPERHAIWVSFWLGWGVAIVIAEWWIRRHARRRG